MKHGKNPTRKQKMLIQAANYNCGDWLVVKDTAEELIIQSKGTDKAQPEIRTIRKELYK
mgnify:CR=1 FL=1